MSLNGNGNGGYQGPERRKSQIAVSSGMSQFSSDAANYFDIENGIFEAMKQPLLIIDEKMRVVLANKSFYDFFGVSSEEITGKFFYDLSERKWNIPSLKKWLHEIFEKNAAFDDFEVEHIFPAIGYKIISLNARRIFQQGDLYRRVLLSFEDITDHKIMARELAESEELRLVAAEAARQRLLIQEKLGAPKNDVDESAVSDYFSKCKKIMRWNGVYTVFSFLITAAGLILAVLFGAMITGSLERIVRPLTEILESLTGYSR